MHIVHVAAECFPFAKVGGLADVVQGLSHTQAELGLKVTIILPRYLWIKTSELKKISSFDITEKKEKRKNTLWVQSQNNLQLFFIDPDNDYFQRHSVYGYDDDISRFLYFSQAVFYLLANMLKNVDILHIHDWHAAILPLLCREFLLENRRPKTVLTVSNMAYQGLGDAHNLDAIGLNGEALLKKEHLQDEKDPKKINLMKGGIIYSDRIVPVSPTYTKELLNDGHGLKQTIIHYRDKFVGILNGIDPSLWNPATDAALQMRYSDNQTPALIEQAKRENKKILSKRLLLNNAPEKPLIANIGRLVPQKGPELIIETIYRTLEEGGQFVLLGSSPIPEIQQEFQSLSQEFKENKDIAFCFGYYEHLAHLLYASSDFLIIPSRFEPCGLTQLIAFRYGTIPIVRKTGGLADTVFDVEDLSTPEEKRNGFTFSHFQKEDLHQTIKRAIKWWKINQQNVAPFSLKLMKLDYSWKRSAEKYHQIYLQILSS